jgi:hypothetical protein
MTPRFLHLSDGSIWASAQVAEDVIERHHHATPPDYDVSSVAGCYLHLLCHPAGTEAAIRKLRALRRAHRAAMAARRDDR